MQSHQHSNSSDELHGFSDFNEIASRLIKNSEHNNQWTSNLKESDTNKETNNNQPNQEQNQKSNIEYLK